MHGLHQVYRNWNNESNRFKFYITTHTYQQYNDAKWLMNFQKVWTMDEIPF